MNKPLHILIVEDSEGDVLLLKRTLEKSGYVLFDEVVDTPDAMKLALSNNKNWDLITSDHSMPQFSAPEALTLAKELCPEVPFIIVSGEIDINLAVSLMKNGAQDYIQKKELARVIPAIERELEEVELRLDNKRANKAIIASDERFREVLENSLDASYKRNSLTNVYEYLSPVFTQISGYTPEEMNNLPLETLMTLIHPDDLGETNRALAKSISSNKKSSHTTEYRFKHKLGHYIWLEDKYSVLRDADGNPITLIGSVSDITERKNLEKALLAEKANLEEAQYIAHLGSWEWDMVGNKVDWSKEMYRIFDINPDTYDGNPESLLKVIHPDDLDNFKNSMAENLLAGNSPSLDYRVVHNDGSIHTIHAEGKVEFDSTGKTIRSIGTIQDITAQKQAEEALRESEEKFKRLHETAGVGVGYYSPDGGVISFNNMAAQHMGGKPQDFMGKSIYELFPKAAADIYMDRIQKAVNSEEYQEYEDKVDLPGEQKWFSSTFSRILNSAHRVLGVQIVSTDVTKSKRSEENLRKSEGKFRTLFEQAAVGMAITDAQSGEFLRINQRFCEILGYTNEEMQGVTFKTITHPDDVQISLEKMELLLLGTIKEFSLEKRYICKDGSAVWVDLTVASMWEPGEDPTSYVTIVQNISERKKLEIALESRLIALTHPLDQPEAFDFKDLFNLEDIQRLQDEFATATGVASIITYPDGTPITKPSNFCRLCNEIIRKTEKGQLNCFKSDAEIGRYHPEEPIFKLCNSGGLWDAGAGISVGGLHLANWLIGQVRDETQTEDRMREYARVIGADEESVVEAFREVPFMSQEQFNNVGQVLFTMANQLSNTAYQNIQQARFISDAKKVEESLRKSEERFHLIDEASQDLIYSYDLQSRFTHANSSLCRVLKLEEEQIIGKTHEELGFPPDQCTEWTILHKKVYSTKATVIAETVTPILGGDSQYYEVVLNPIRNEKGNIIGIAGTTRDINARKLAELKINEQLDELRRWYEVTVGREERMIKLKDEVNILLTEAGKPPRYSITKGD